MTHIAAWTARSLAARALGRIDEAIRAVVPPIHVATTYLRDPDNQYRSGNFYGRPDDETVREAEAVFAALAGSRTWPTSTRTSTRRWSSPPVLEA